MLDEFLDVANERWAKLDLDAARSLILDAFALLPWDLQEDYREIQELYHAGHLVEAGQAWDAWMDKAREMGLI